MIQEKKNIHQVQCPQCSTSLRVSNRQHAYVCPVCKKLIKFRLVRTYTVCVDDIIEIKEYCKQEEVLEKQVETVEVKEVSTALVEEVAQEIVQDGEKEEKLEIAVKTEIPFGFEDVEDVEDVEDDQDAEEVETESIAENTLVASVSEETKAIRRKAKVKKTIFLAIKWGFLLLLSVFFLFPVYALLINSVMPNEQLLGVKTLWPKYFYFGAYKKMFNVEYLGYLKNTLFVCVMNMLGVCFGSSLCAYGLAKVNFKGKNIMFMIIMSTVLLPGTVTSIPLFIIYNKLQWTGTLLPLWVPIWLGGGAMNIFLVRQFMKGIPHSYSEAAILDGAGSFRIYWNIVLPLVRPVLVYLAVTTFFGCWNDYTGPLMYVADAKESWTLSLALYKDFGIKNSTKPSLANEQMAIGVWMMIPCVILFAFFQKELMEGIAAIGIKG